MGKGGGGLMVDHKDRNPLNNRRSNLRFVTGSQNAVNKSKAKGTTSKYRGVSWRGYASQKKPWYAYSRSPDGKQLSLGHFTNEDDAARAYDAFAKTRWGEFAPLNFS